MGEQDVAEFFRGFLLFCAIISFMLRLGIISDTHGSLPDAVYGAFEHVDHIIHAGDIGSPSILWELESIAPTMAVLGNNDWQDFGSCVHESAQLTLEDVDIFVTHYPDEAQREALSGEFNLVIHGHTHIPRQELCKTTMLLNPGSTTRPRAGNDPSVMKLTLNDGHIGPVQLVNLLDL